MTNLFKINSACNFFSSWLTLLKILTYEYIINYRGWNRFIWIFWCLKVSTRATEFKGASIKILKSLNHTLTQTCVILPVLDSWHMFVWPCDCFIVWLHVFQDFYSSIINFPVRVDTFKHKNHVSSPYRSDSSYRLKLATLSMRGSSPSTQGVCGLTLLWRKHDISMSSKHQNSVILFACITSAPNDKTLKTFIT